MRLTFREKKNMTENDLKYKYQWITHPLGATWKTDENLFDRNDGREVINMVNDILNGLKLNNKEAGQKIEAFIKLDLPYTIRKRKDVKDWILKNMKSF